MESLFAARLELMVTKSPPRFVQPRSVAHGRPDLLFCLMDRFGSIQHPVFVLARDDDYTIRISQQDVTGGNARAADRDDAIHSSTCTRSLPVRIQWPRLKTG